VSDATSRFSLQDKVCIITGGAGLLGIQHAEAVAEAGGVPVLWDIDPAGMESALAAIRSSGAARVSGSVVDITSKRAIDQALKEAQATHGNVHALINNAARNPKAEKEDDRGWSRLENFPQELWEQDLQVGLTGAFLASQAVGTAIAQEGGGVILNIASDLGLIAPDQRIYGRADMSDAEQPKKPITYSVVKHGLIGLTRYLATYWAENNVRVNALCPGGVFNGQPEAFVAKLTSLIPMGRMAAEDEYKAAVIFMLSEASSYMTGACVPIDGGRTCW